MRLQLDFDFLERASAHVVILNCILSSVEGLIQNQ